MRILVVSNVYPPNFIGGAELIAHQQVQALRAAGHEVFVFAGEIVPFGEHHAMRREEWEGIPVFRVSMLPKDYEATYINFSHPSIETSFAAVMDEVAPEVVHCHNLTGLSAGVLRRAKRGGATVVVTLHDHWGFCFKNTLLKHRGEICHDYTECAQCMPTIDDERELGIPIRMRNDQTAVMLNHADALVAPSHYLAGTYARAGFDPDLFHVIPNGIDVHRFDEVRNARRRAKHLRLSFVGGLYSHKGVASLCEALGHLPKGAALRVNIVGTGDQRVRCERILKANGWLKRVRFWGHIDNERISEVYRETDVHVLPSLWPENQPVTITEAMACGVPSIVSDLGGSKELIEARESGDVFRAGDVVDLAQAIQRFLDDPSRAERMGRVARRKIESLTFEKQVGSLGDLYRNMRAAASPPRLPRRLVVCHGLPMDRKCAQIMAQFPASEGWRFVHREWIDEELANFAWLHWSVLGHLDPHLPDGEDAAVPMLTELEAAGGPSWSTRRRILYYADPSQAARWLRRLDAIPPLYHAVRSGGGAGPAPWL